MKQGKSPLSAAREIKLSFSLAALVQLALGIFLILAPNTSRALICTVVAIGVTAYGLFYLLNYALHRDAGAFTMDLIIGVAAAAFGIFSIINPTFLIDILIIALGLIMTMKGDFGVNIYNTAYIMIVAYLIKYLMMGMRTVVSAMSQIHVSLEECSQISGASWTRTMVRITGPLIFPSIAAGWFLIFIPSFYELSMTTLLYSNTTKTIGFQLYEYWTYTSQPQACAMAFGILMIVVALNFLLNKLTKGEFSI